MRSVIYTLLLVCFTTLVFAQDLHPVMDTTMTEDANGAVKAELKWGFKNAENSWVVFPVFDHAEAFVEGLAKVGLKEAGSWKYGFIDRTGELVVPLMYDHLGNFHNGMAYAAILNIAWEDKPDEMYNKVGYIDKNNQMVLTLPDKYSRPSSRCYYIGTDFSGGLAKMHISDERMCPSYGPIVVDLDGNVMVIKEED